MRPKKSVDPIDVHVGRRLALVRNARGLTQARLGALVGVALQQIQKYESATNRISASRLAHLASSLNVPIGWFFASLPPDVGQEESKDILALEETYTLIHAYYEIKEPRRRKAVFKVIRSLAD
jgi:transcriptional regulator with XRE-family HTH domain